MFGKFCNLTSSSVQPDKYSGRPCLLMSHIPTQTGGAWNEMTGEISILYGVSASLTPGAVLKVNRMMEIAFENDLPLISLVQSVSARSKLSYIKLALTLIGWRLLAATISSLPQGRPAIPRPCSTYAAWETIMCNRVWIFDGRWSVPPSLVGLYDLCREPSPGLPRWSASGEDGYRRGDWS